MIASTLEVHRVRVFNTDVEYAAMGAGAAEYERIEEWLRSLDARFSRFREDSELSALNSSGGEWVTISHEMSQMLAHALRVEADSLGLVNIATTQALIDVGYRRPWPAAWVGAGEEPSPVRPLFEVLELGRGRARLAAGVNVDFGAIAKGVWADEAVRRLGGDAVVSLGGDVAARGGGPVGEGWAVQVPGDRVVMLSVGGVATSGVTKRASDVAHHIIDPRTGAPAAVDAQTITVLAATATAAEWAATALIIDQSQCERLAARGVVDAVWADGAALIVRKDNA
ncbi:hypothetical protein GCM10025768_01460 [Microbacterium pseudoresistens]|uniref:FAD:protein FMN transferase n=1 Tax=Microbacterium pseudoresistens TaxID=640634 RepID=A0A7Y9EUB1_9MICO|nr:FAD:protein FMN transferase [Microbacterium pseudoresistens]NYD53981.1 thiamine biosynthesis lipoprotein [Microbacterium pseudoresistens]